MFCPSLLNLKRLATLLSCFLYHQYHETYTDPALRASLQPKFDHLQQHEPVDDDAKFGQINIVAAPKGKLGEVRSLYM